MILCSVPPGGFTQPPIETIGRQGGYGSRKPCSTGLRWIASRRTVRMAASVGATRSICRKSSSPPGHRGRINQSRRRGRQTSRATRPPHPSTHTAAFFHAGEAHALNRKFLADERVQVLAALENVAPGCLRFGMRPVQRAAERIRDFHPKDGLTSESGCHGPGIFCQCC